MANRDDIAATGFELIEAGVKLILAGLDREFDIGISKDINFKDTPKRVAKTYLELCAGAKDTDKQIAGILTSVFPETYSSLVIVSGVKTVSICKHHLLPVLLTTSIGYKPHEKVLGVSKLARLVEILSKRPLLQEQFTRELVDYLQDVLQPVGAMAVVRGEHMCMRIRGIRSRSSEMTTYRVSGIFETDSLLRSEFLKLSDNAIIS